MYNTAIHEALHYVGVHACLRLFFPICSKANILLTTKYTCSDVEIYEQNNLQQ